MSARVEKIARYPVKGLSPQPLGAVELAPGEGLPHDRRFALTHGASGYDPGAPGWRPKGNFLNLARHERLAALETHFDPETGMFEVRRNGRPVTRGRITTPTGRMLIEQFFAAYMAGSAPGLPHLVETPGVMFSDTEDKLVSVINASSVRDLEQRVVQAPIDPDRFRGNLLIDGAEPWAEMRWVGRQVAVGAAVLEIVEPIGRCAATNVAPGTGQRDLNIPLALRRGYGHTDCGVYGRVVRGGRVAVGDPVRLLD